MKKLVGLFFLVGTLAFSQSKIKIGGGVGLGFGDQTTIELSPNISYALLPNVDVGIEADYIYNKDDDFKQNAFGGGVFARPYFGNLFGYAAYKIHNISTDFDNAFNQLEEDRTVDALWIGGGYRKNLGGINVYVGAMYDVLHDDDESLYSSGFRPYAGVGIGL